MKNFVYLMVGVLERGGCEEQDCQNLPSTGMFLFFGFKSPAPTPQKKHIFALLLAAAKFFWGGRCLGNRRYCSAVHVDVRVDSNRSSCSAPSACVWHT
jgi:hypothetical protein